MDRKFEKWLIYILVLGIIWSVYTLGICLISENVKLVPMSMGIYVMIALILAWFFSEKSRLQKVMYRWAIVSAIAIAIFWTIWWLIKGQVPVVNAISFGDFGKIQSPYAISRWWDILAGPIWLAVLLFLVEKFTVLEKPFFKMNTKEKLLHCWSVTWLLCFIAVAKGLVFTVIGGLIIGLALSGLLSMCIVIYYFFNLLFSRGKILMYHSKPMLKKLARWLDGY